MESMVSMTNQSVCAKCGDPTCMGETYHKIHGAWGPNDVRRAFVAGAKWWEFLQTSGTLWSSDRAKAEAEAERRYLGTLDGHAGSRIMAQAYDAQGGHTRLDETRAKQMPGTLYERISWLLDLLTSENAELRHTLAATVAERDSLQALLTAAEHRRAAIEYRLTCMELDRKLKD